MKSQRTDPASILHLYRRLLRVRASSDALASGSWLDLPARDGALLYERSFAQDRRAVLINFTDQRLHVPLDYTATVEVDSNGAGEGSEWTGTLEASGAVVLRPRPEEELS